MSPSPYCQLSLVTENLKKIANRKRTGRHHEESRIKRLI